MGWKIVNPWPGRKNFAPLETKSGFYNFPVATAGWTGRRMGPGIVVVSFGVTTVVTRSQVFRLLVSRLRRISRLSRNSTLRTKSPMSPGSRLVSGRIWARWTSGLARPYKMAWEEPPRKIWQNQVDDDLGCAVLKERTSPVSGAIHRAGQRHHCRIRSPRLHHVAAPAVLPWPLLMTMFPACLCLRSFQ